MKKMISYVNAIGLALAITNANLAPSAEAASPIPAIQYRIAKCIGMHSALIEIASTQPTDKSILERQRSQLARLQSPAQGRATGKVGFAEYNRVMDIMQELFRQGDSDRAYAEYRTQFVNAQNCYNGLAR